MNKQTRFNILYWILAFIGVLVLQYLLVTAREVAPIPYSDFERYLREGKVTEVAVLGQLHPGRAEAAAARRAEPIRDNAGRPGLCP
jgi:cell division protease FtsH